MNKIIETEGYKISYDTHFFDKEYGITDELSGQFEWLHNECEKKNNPKIIDKLNRLIEKYPTVPILKNYLSIAWVNMGNHKKAEEVTKQIIAEHPGYVFGILNQASICIEKKDYDKVPGLIGKSLDIRDLYPEREVFQIGEVTSYMKLVIRYYISIDKPELAEEKFHLLEQIALDHPDTETARFLLFPYRSQSMQKMMEEDNKNRISTVITRVLPVQTKESPLFNHPEILNLYEYDFRIPKHLLREILELPRKTVIEDLEKVLADSVERYDWFSGKKYDVNTHSFIFHAIFLLMELKAEESLSKILTFLEYDEEILDYWLGDHKTETVWQSIHIIGLSKTNELKQFLLKPGIYGYSKTIVSEALAQIAIHYPGRRNEILSIFSDTLTCILNAKRDDNIIDTDFTGLLIGDAIHCGFCELLPLIKLLYDKNYVPPLINGDYDEIEKDITREEPFENKSELLNIFDFYDHVVDTWYGYGREDMEDEDYDDEDYYDDDGYIFPIEKPEMAVSEKIGRNEPCPCGSGKKYKKCCWGK
jgi:hypothetical protein